MESNCFHKLLEYFSRPLKIEKQGEELVIYHNIPLDEYEPFFNSIVSQFIGECTRNRGSDKDNPYLVIEYRNIRQKFAFAFRRKFQVDFDNPDKSLNYEIFDIENTDFPKVYKDLINNYWDIFHFVINYLDQTIKEITNQSTPKLGVNKDRRSKADHRNFRLNYSSDEQFADLYNYLEAIRFIDKTTSRDCFINVFSGKKSENKIIWTGDQASLYLFIKALNDKGCFRTKLYDGIWDMVADRFKPSNRDFYYAEKLKHSSQTRKKDYSIVEEVASYAHDLLNDGNEF